MALRADADQRAHGQPIATAVELAVTRAARRRGLLGRDGLDASRADARALPRRAHGVHALRHRRDVRRSRRLRGEDRPGARAVAAGDLFGARHVVELAAGELAAGDVQVGDRLYLTTATGKVDKRLWSPSWLVDIGMRTTA